MNWLQWATIGLNIFTMCMVVATCFINAQTANILDEVNDNLDDIRRRMQ